MKNLNLYILGIIAIMFSACSTNQDLATLNEYDDVYYQGTRAAVASKAPVSVNDNTMGGASDAERSYYQNAPYTESETESTDNTYDSDSDYYDEDYGNRIDNFHRSNDGDYQYSYSQNTSPSLSYSMGYGMGPYGSGMNMGFSYGSPGYYGGMGMYNSIYMGYNNPYYMSPWYSPYYYPYYYARPYYGYGGYYNPYPYYPSYGYGGGYYGGGYYGGGDYYGGTSGVTSTPRQSTGSVRPSRGGVITEGNNNRSSERSEMTTGSPNNTVGSTTRSTETRTSGVAEQTDLRGKDVRTREGLNRNDIPANDVRGNDVRSTNRPAGVRDNNTATREYTRPGTTRNDYIRSEQRSRQTPGTAPSQTVNPNGYRNPGGSVSPSQTPTGTLAPAMRSRSGSTSPNINSQPTRVNTAPSSRSRTTSPNYNRQRSSSPRQQTTAPSRSYSSPAPTRSSGGGSFGGGGGGTSSPASTPSRGSRR